MTIIQIFTLITQALIMPLMGSGQRFLPDHLAPDIDQVIAIGRLLFQLGCSFQQQLPCLGHLRDQIQQCSLNTQSH